MHDLVAITALGDVEPRVEMVGGVTCSEVPAVALASVTARARRETETRKKLARLIGKSAPDVGQFSGDVVTAFWTGPDQWMVEAPFESHEELAHLTKECVGDTSSVSEQTDAWTRFDLAGSDVLAVLELLCALDCRRMVPGKVARTSIHHLGCFVLCRSVELFSVYGPRSSAGSLHHALLAAMKSAL